MLKLIKEFAQKNFNKIKPNDIIIVTDNVGDKIAGRVKEYTEDTIVIEHTEYIRFNSREVTIEKIN
jgi:hypothetical protein